MIRRITMLVAAALVALALSAPVALAAPTLPAGCEKVKGQIVCEVVVEGKNPQGKFDETTTTTTQGNLTNFSPTPQGVGVEEECNRPGQTEKCPPGQF
jgi:phosphate-selective porin